MKGSLQTLRCVEWRATRCHESRSPPGLHATTHFSRSDFRVRRRGGGGRDYVDSEDRTPKRVFSSGTVCKLLTGRHCFIEMTLRISHIFGSTPTWHASVKYTNRLFCAFILQGNGRKPR